MLCVKLEKLGSKECFRNLLVNFSRFLGVSTSVVLFAVGFDAAYHHFEGGACIMFGAIVVFLLETLWVVTTFLEICYHRSHHPCWIDFVSWIIWPRSITYTVAACILILHPHRLWLYWVAGTMMLGLVLCHILLAVGGNRNEMKAMLIRGDDGMSCSEEGESTNQRISIYPDQQI